MRKPIFSLAAISFAILLVGAGCAGRPAANKPAEEQPLKETPAVSAPAAKNGLQPAPEVSQDDLNRLKSEIQGSNFDDITSLNE